MDKAKILNEIKRKPQLQELSDDEIEWFVDSAIRKCLRTTFPLHFDKTEEDIDYPFFHGWVIDASVSMIESIGVGNIKSYSENGLSISYNEMVDGIPTRLLNELPNFGNTVHKK